MKLRRFFVLLCVAACYGFVAVAGGQPAAPAEAAKPVWPPGLEKVDPRLTPIETRLPKGGHYARADDGSLMTILGDTFYRSANDGEKWETHTITELKAKGLRPRSGNVLLYTPQGTLIFIFLNDADKQWKWNKETGRLDGEAWLHTWVARSEDSGKSWIDIQRIQDGYAGALRDAIVTRDGHLVAALQKWLPKEERHVTIPTVSIDDGRTWKATEVLDVGGRGHHDGAFESSVVELNDGRVWMLLRTSLDYFWQSFSKDGGMTWSKPVPTTIDTSNSPGIVKRLASGRLVLLWNRLYPQGKTEVRRVAKDYSKHAASWQRQELSIAFSSDDGKSWTEPVVIAKGKSLVYPMLYEIKPGVLWVFAPRGPLRAELREADFVPVQASKTSTSEAGVVSNTSAPR